MCAVLSVLVITSGGCVFWDIRDEVRNTNSRLDAVDAQLAATNDGLDATNAKLEGVNTQLKKVDTSLERLDATNLSLANMEDRLTLLRSLVTSLSSVDVHLASLRKTIGRIDGMIPFLDLGTEGDPEPTPAAEVAEATPPTDPAAPKSGEAPAPKEAAPSRRDGLLGVWVSQYPDRATVIVLQDGGRYVRQRAAQPPNTPFVESGTWKRDGKRLELVSDARDATGPDAKKATPSTTHSWEIVSQTVKSLALRSEADGMIVLAKP